MLTATPALAAASHSMRAVFMTGAALLTAVALVVTRAMGHNPVRPGRAETWRAIK